MTADPIAEPALFDITAPPPITLRDRFGVPPFSILDRRMGAWQERKRRWLSLGIQSELGRNDTLLRSKYKTDINSEMGWVEQAMYDLTPGGMTSVFDPVLCELIYRWFTRPGDRVLDPFCGGSVRGITASLLERWYTGIDLRPEQVKANEEQESLGSDTHWPIWLAGDATQQDAVLGPPTEGGGYDLIFTCPPYADLERYSDDPADLSTMDYTRFAIAHARAIRQAADRLAPNRYAVWVISDVRDKAGHYRGLVGHTIQAFQTAGLHLYNDAILLDPVGTSALRAPYMFTRTRKMIRMHQHVLVFLKGDVQPAARRLDPPPPATPEDPEEVAE